MASVAIAAHEVGHAIQHEKAYAPFRVRSAMFPAVAFASKSWLVLLMIGVFAQIAGTRAARDHPVRGGGAVPARDAAGRVRRLAAGKAQLHSLGLVSAGEEQGVSKVLSAAAMTYVAAALAALSQLAYYALVFLGNRN